jgi:threonine/homoserine/homoserine lactone efflux protein
VITLAAAFGIATVAFGMVITPGPNMMYLVSRSLTQGRLAGFVSLGGVVTGLVIYLLATAVGLAVLFKTVPTLFVVVKVAGAAYLLWLAWTMVRGSSKVFRPGASESHSVRRLYLMGLATCLLNPKIALLYVALLPQFVQPERGSVWAQTVQLGVVQVVVAAAINAAWVLAASQMALVLAKSRAAERVVRLATAGLLAWFAVHLGLAQPAAGHR